MDRDLYAILEIRIDVIRLDSSSCGISRFEGSNRGTVRASVVLVKLN